MKPNNSSTKKKTRVQILSEVFAKLSYYRYRKDDTGKEANIEHEEKIAQFFANKNGLTGKHASVQRSAIQQFAPAIMRNIKKRMHMEKVLGNKNTLLTPQLINDNGWVTIDHIEEYKCPYGSPENKRNEYLLIPEIIEIDTLQYYVKESNKNSKLIRSRTVYRLKRDEFTYNFLKYWFKYIYSDNYIFGEVFDFRGSDYYTDLTPPELYQLEDDIDYLGWFFEQKINNKQIPPSIERINQALTIMKKMQKIISKDPLYSKLQKEYINEDKDYTDYTTSILPSMRRDEAIRNLIKKLRSGEYNQPKKKDMLKKDRK